jgi:hypothetical protein
VGNYAGVRIRLTFGNIEITGLVTTNYRSGHVLTYPVPDEFSDFPFFPTLGVDAKELLQ